ncbi:MAG: hypothetical protein Q4C49_00630 [Bacillota bacterium]|nr:hypothetical protein [Bacillota bacterium]
MMLAYVRAKDPDLYYKMINAVKESDLFKNSSNFGSNYETITSQSEEFIVRQIENQLVE